MTTLWQPRSDRENFVVVELSVRLFSHQFLTGHDFLSGFVLLICIFYMFFGGVGKKINGLSENIFIFIALRRNIYFFGVRGTRGKSL